MRVPLGLRWLITGAFVVLIVILSVTPGQATSGDTGFVWLVAVTPPPLQKLMHVVIYGMLAALWVWTLAKVKTTPLRLALAFVLTVGLGAILEWYQTQVPGRFGTLNDVLLNAVGAAAGLLVAVLVL